LRHLGIVLSPCHRFEFTTHVYYEIMKVGNRQTTYFDMIFKKNIYFKILHTCDKNDGVFCM